MTKQDSIQSLRAQGYKLKYLPKGSKELTRKWKDTPTDDTIPDGCNYAVIQDGNKFVIDIDDPQFNNVLEEYFEGTLAVKTGGGGIHVYFKDIPRIKPIKTTKLYYKGQIIGDIKAALSYVVGPGSSHFTGNDYKQVSTTDKVLEMDCESILLTLKKHGITTKSTPKVTAVTTFEEGAAVGERNIECFKKACYLFDQEKSTYESGLNFILTWNEKFSEPLDTREVETTVKSAWNTVYGKEISFEGHDKIDKVAAELQKNHKFVTDKKTDEILLYNGKIYDKLQSEALIKEKTEKLIPNCTTHYRTEVINKIKAQTYTDLEEFDSNPNEITVENGILNLDTLELKDHTPEHLSRVLLPVRYIRPQHEDIEENLKDTLFWKSLKASFTVDGKFRPIDFLTVLEVIASTFVKKPIDDKAIMFLGSGDNGKSVFLSYTESLLGKSNVSSIPLQDLTNDKFLTANLDGKSANIFSDLEKNELRHTGKIKPIVSNEGIEVQKKNKQGYTLYPFCKLIFSCNKFPKVFDQSQGFFRRWVIVKWERNFENDSARDENLLEKLLENQEERNLVFSCLVKLANKLNKTGKFTHSASWRIIQQEWNQNADPVADFDAHCIKDSKFNKPKNEVYKCYRNWCYFKGETPLGMGKFSKEFCEYHEELIEKDLDDRTRRVWCNIDFKIPKDAKLEDFDFS